jgi:hypothetical protein
MQRLLISLLSLGLTISGLFAQATGDKRAMELIGQARAALGGENKLAKVQGLSGTGSYRRALQDRELAGELTLELQLPDKIIRTESANPFGDLTVITRQGLNGEALLRSQHAVNAPPGAVISGGPQPTGDALTQAIRGQRAEMARLALALLLTAPPGVPIEFSYAGEAEAADGKADVLDAKGPSSFGAKLFLDKSSHRPLMLAYKGAAPQMRITTQRGDGPPPEGGRRTAGPGRGGGPEPPTAPAPQIVDINMFFEDYQQVDGIWLPFHVSKSVDGKPSEEWTFKAIKVNPSFKADTFAAK